jgi:hypothetical protein
VSEENPYRVFVTHVFQDDEDYQRVFEYLESRDQFFYLTSSDLAKMPESGGLEAMKEELREQIKPAEVVIMPITTFETNPDLVRFQMDVAEAFAKPILAVKSFGDTVVIQKEMIDRCADIIEWNERTMIEAIKRLGRNEETAQWEVIDFDLD